MLREAVPKKAVPSERIKRYPIPIGKGLGLLLFFLTPAFSYVLFGYVTGNLPNIPLQLASLNILWMAVFYVA